MCHCMHICCWFIACTSASQSGLCVQIRQWPVIVNTAETFDPDINYGTVEEQVGKYPENFHFVGYRLTEGHESE